MENLFNVLARGEGALEAYVSLPEPVVALGK